MLLDALTNTHLGLRKSWAQSKNISFCEGRYYKQSFFCLYRVEMQAMAVCAIGNLPKYDNYVGIYCLWCKNMFVVCYAFILVIKW